MGKGTTVEITGPDGKTTGPMDADAFHASIENLIGGKVESESDKPLAGGMNLGEFKKQVLNGRDPEQVYFGIPSDGAFEDEGVGYLDDEDLQDLGDVVIKSKFPLLAAHHVKMRFVWKRKGGGPTGRSKIGECSVVGAKARLFTDTKFIVWLAADHCRVMKFTNFAVEALLFHELGHAGFDPEGGPYIIPHDYEGFNRELAEYGPWKEDLARMARIARQLELPLDFKVVTAPPPEPKAEKKKTITVRRDPPVLTGGSGKTH